MTRTRVRYRCEACGTQSPKWLGRCADCGEWGSLVEEVAVVAGAAGGGGIGGGGRLDGAPTSVVMPLLEVGTAAGAVVRPTGVGEFDRVLGGGLVPGSVTLVGG